MGSVFAATVGDPPAGGQEVTLFGGPLRPADQLADKESIWV